MENLANGQANENCDENPINNSTSSALSTNNKDVNLDFLPLIYDIIKSIEREPIQDSTLKSREGLDTSIKVLELEKKLAEARQQINLLPGIEHSPEEQLRLIEKCRQQVLLKQRLISKYKSLGTFPPAEH